jgi:hypothetical protein
MNQGITRRDFLIMATGVTGAVMLSPLITKASQLIPQHENLSPALEDWLLSTRIADFEPTISFLLNGNTTTVYLPFVSK